MPLTLGAGARLLPDSRCPLSAPPGRSSPRSRRCAARVQADLLIVAPFSLPVRLLTAVSRLPGVVAAEQIEAVRMRINGAYTAVARR